METTPIIVEQIINAPVKRVWKALTDNDILKKWHFDIPGFRALPGFSFQFYEEGENRQYLHVCRILNAVENKQLSYSWRFNGYPGNSVVTFDLEEMQNGKTKVILTHEGVDTFSEDCSDPNMSPDVFEVGWIDKIKNLLKKSIEKEFDTQPELQSQQVDI